MLGPIVRYCIVPLIQRDLRVCYNNNTPRWLLHLRRDSITKEISVLNRIPIFGELTRQNIYQSKTPACNITTGPVASCKWIRQKMAMGQAEQDPDLPRSASTVFGKVQ